MIFGRLSTIEAKVCYDRCDEATQPSPCLSSGRCVARGMGWREDSRSDPCAGWHVGAQVQDVHVGVANFLLFRAHCSVLVANF